MRPGTLLCWNASGNSKSAGSSGAALSRACFFCYALLGVAHRVLDILMPEPCLQRPRVVPGISQGVAAAVGKSRPVVGPTRRVGATKKSG
jgi:hypothetical protein